jgi:hypothetical protein
MRRLSRAQNLSATSPASVPVVIGNDSRLSIAENYRRFSRDEAAGRSPLYAELTAGVAGDPLLLDYLAQQPPPKRQPNLLLAAIRFLYGTQDDYGSFRAAVLEHRDEVAATLASRRTQTNEPARCAVLMPLLAALPQPLALLEVGAAAGLCLLPDRYGYRYGEHVLGAVTPRFECSTIGPVPVPSRLPQIVWRAGIDLEPIDLGDADAVGWLEALVWPDQPQRLERLREAVAVARADPPLLIRGDLIERLADVAAAAPRDATLVVFHTAVLAYLDPLRREEFGHAVAALGAHWISNEGADVISDLRVAPALAPKLSRSFVIAQDRSPVALADPHGAWIEWIAS